MITLNKQTKIGLVAVVVILIFLIGLGYFGKSKSGSLGGNELAGNDVLRILTPGDRQKLEAEVASLEAQENSLPADPQNRYDFYYRLAVRRYALGRDKDAMAALDKIVDEKGDYTYPDQVWYTYANIYNDSKDYDRAVVAMSKAVDIDGTNPQYWLTYIGIWGQKDPKKNLTDLYNEALTKTGNAIEVVRAYGRYLEYLGQKDAAIVEWQKAGEVDPAGKADYDAEIKKLQTAQ
ncbi:MAG TPA: hypothetical protein VL306_00385 [Methylomirabilota bacterium]|jgi:tetratricopeptide (TPR) repeat protein|nr:hypothetical protein [Methylomirabilota bacterium]